MPVAADPRSEELSRLLARVGLADRAAFATLYQRTSAQLLGVVLRIQRDRALAEDVLQEVFVNIWRAADSFDPVRSQPMTWLASVARNRAIDSLRRRETQPVFESTSRGGPDGEEMDLLDQVPSDVPGPQDLMGLMSQARAVKRCLGSLSGEQQQCIALAFYQGLSHAEVATHLHQPLGSVKSWVRRGLVSLKTCLQRSAAMGF
ncbi:MAG TPA: sigma-70 family RNA polymerase sigma factor [Burkholderiaceae bacterium]|nr:sigma-70 family RNA polymerase sigma factor [Burkholderiaceae bacterium]